MKTGSWNNRTLKCISLALIFVAISALSGCGGSPARDTSGENAPGNGTQTETVPYAPADTSLDRVYFLNGNDIYEENGTVRQIQSDCALIRSNGRWGLVDVGIGNYGNIGSQISGQLGQLAESNGGSIQLDFVVITHSHVDHGGYFAGLFEDNLQITMSDDCVIYLKEYEDNNPSYSNPEAENLYNNAQVYAGIMDTLEARFGDSLDSHLRRSDYEPVTFGDFTIRFFNSGAEAAVSGRLNDNSTVLLLTHANGTMLLMMGDCEISAENNLLAGEMAGISGIDILKAGHHGNASSSGPAFMAQMQPKAVIATGIYGMYVAGEGGSLAYKCLTLGAPLYSPQFNQDGLVVAFGDGEKEYSFFNGISEGTAAVQNPMEAGVISFNSIFQIEIDDTLSLVQNAS